MDRLFWAARRLFLRYPKAVSVAIGLFFMTLLLTFGIRDRPVDAVDLAFAALLGGVAAVSAYRTYRRLWPDP